MAGLPPNPYKALGVEKDATLATIARAFRKLALRYHPDRGGDPDKFYKILAAYEVLTDDRSRQRYDDQVKLAELKAELTRNGGKKGMLRYSQRRQSRYSWRHQSQSVDSSSTDSDISDEDWQKRKKLVAK